MPSPQPGPIDSTIHEDVAVIRLRRPAVLNALDPPMLSAFLARAARAATDDSVRAIVVTGGPDAFCTGEDLRAAVGGPAYVDVLDALPRTPTEKVEKYRLAERGVSATTTDAEQAPGTAMRARGAR